MISRLLFPSGCVHPLYTRHITWSFVSSALVSIETVVSTHNMLSAINGGSETLRTVNYIGKDIIGQLGGLWFMSKMSSEADKHPKRFLLYSNLIQQSAYVTICFTPIAPDYFLPVAGVANLMLNIAFTGFGAINAKCIQKLTKDHVGETYAKITILNTMGSSLGLVTGLGVMSLTADNCLAHVAIVATVGSMRVYSFNKATEGLI